MSPAKQKLRKIKSIVIAPNVSLPKERSEVEAIVNRLGAKLLHENVTLKTLAEAMLQNWDYIHIITHGDENGIVLDNETISVSILGSLLMQARPSCVYLNSCMSRMKIEELKSNLPGCILVTNLGDVDDNLAFLAGSRFAFEVARGANFREAYMEAAKINKNMVLLNGSSEMAQGDDGFIRELEQRVFHHDVRMSQILSEMHKMNQTLEAMRKTIEETDARLQKLQDVQKVNRYINTVVFCLVATLVVYLLIVDLWMPKLF